MSFEERDFTSWRQCLRCARRWQFGPARCECGAASAPILDPEVGEALDKLPPPDWLRCPLSECYSDEYKAAMKALLDSHPTFKKL
jgi:hypothetical protein